MQMSYTETLTIVRCTCGIPYAIPADLNENLLRDGPARSVFCPSGHRWHYTDSIEKKLERERRAHQATRELLATEERSHSATKGQLTKAKKKVHRAEHGVCPHCNRSFQNLQRHVATKHPECL